TERKGREELIRLRNAFDSAYQHLNESSKKTFTDGKSEFQVRYFTDTLFIGYPIRERIGALLSLLKVMHYIGFLQMELAREGYFIRGALSVGDLYVDDQIVFGPALMEAYRAEQQRAVFPRVILCESAEAPFRAESL